MPSFIAPTLISCSPLLHPCFALLSPLAKLLQPLLFLLPDPLAPPHSHTQPSGANSAGAASTWHFHVALFPALLSTCINLCRRRNAKDRFQAGEGEKAAQIPDGWWVRFANILQPVVQNGKAAAAPHSWLLITAAAGPRGRHPPRISKECTSHFPLN